MKSLSIASLALVLALSGCASDKFYDLGYEIGSSEQLIKRWEENSKMDKDSTFRTTFRDLCTSLFDVYLRQTSDESFALPTSEELESLVKGCGNGWTDATRR